MRTYSPVEAYGYIGRRLSLGESMARVADRAIARYGQDHVMQIEDLVSRAITAFAAGARLTVADGSYSLPDDEIPIVPGTADQYVYIMQVWHNPGEYIWVRKIGGKSVSLQELLVLAVAALREWKARKGGSPGILVGEGYVAYKGGLADVPEGYFRVTIKRVEREISEGSVGFAATFGMLAQRIQSP